MMWRKMLVKGEKNFTRKGWWGAVSPRLVKCVSCKHEELSSNLRDHVCMVACSGNSRTMEVGTGGSLGLSRQPV